MMVVRRYSKSRPGNWVCRRWMVWCSVCGDAVEPGLKYAWVTVPAGQMCPSAPTRCPLYTTNFRRTFRTSCLSEAHSLTPLTVATSILLPPWDHVPDSFLWAGGSPFGLHGSGKGNPPSFVPTLCTSASFEVGPPSAAPSDLSTLFPSFKASSAHFPPPGANSELKLLTPLNIPDLVSSHWSFIWANLTQMHLGSSHCPFTPRSRILLFLIL